ncbi:MFS transporter [Pseudonocardia acaciae]|uniref:MFS transporter n=1 Tax=Pseudonocardia acaciae TaxID=551276 RepID=UPI0012EEDD0F|nr:MFS transporter [Pseudonocardia acaciae]
MTTKATPPRRSRTPLLITLYAGGGEFCDGYILSVVGVSLPFLGAQFQLTGAQSGLIGSAALVGMFLGGLIFGYVTDLVGRQKIYLFDIGAFIVLSTLQFFATSPWQLIVLRLLMGIAIGADFAIASTLVSEFAPKRSRGPLLVMLATMWSVGAAVAYIAGWLIVSSTDDPEVWRWVLGSSVVPSVLILFLRMGTPESPRWLLSKGRRAEAGAALRKMLGPDARIEDIAVDEGEPTRYSTIFRPPYRRRIVFVCLFWACQLLPIYAISTYEPTILESFGLREGSYLGAAVLQVFFVFGSLSGALFVNRGRRKLLLVSFGVAAAALGGLAALANPPTALVIALFVLFGLGVYSAQCLESLYPSELFPTRVRATARGFATGMSRIGAAVGTFGAPLLLSTNIQLAMGVGAAVCVVGLVSSYFLAPETRGLTLEEASGESVGTRATH